MSQNFSKLGHFTALFILYDLLYDDILEFLLKMRRPHSLITINVLAITALYLTIDLDVIKNAVVCWCDKELVLDG